MKIRMRDSGEVLEMSERAASRWIMRGLADDEAQLANAIKPPPAEVRYVKVCLRDTGEVAEMSDTAGARWIKRGLADEIVGPIQSITPRRVTLKGSRAKRRNMQI